MKSNQAEYVPTGYQWTDLQTGRREMLCTSGIWKDWILYQHPDGQWVSLRQVSLAESKTITDKFTKVRFA